MKVMAKKANWVACVALALTTFVQPALAQTWQTYGTTVEGSWEIDVSRFSTEGAYVRYWVRHVTPPKLFANGKEVIQQYAANCASRQIAVTSSVERDSKGKVLSQGTIAQNLWRFNPVPPGSIGEGALNLVCRAGGAANAKPSLLLSRVPTPPDWHFIATDGKGEYRLSISPKSIARLDGGLTSVVGNATYTTAQKAPNGEAYLYFVFEAYVDCKNTALDLMRQEYISVEYNVVDTFEKNVQQRNLQASPPDSVAGQAMLYVCGQQTKVEPSVASKNAADDIQIGSGTGWVVARGKIVTANHVVAGADTILIYGPDKKPMEATVLAKDEPNDIAILSADFGTWRPQSLSLARVPTRLGSRVFTIGFPQFQVLGAAPKFTSGEISANSGMKDDPRYFQISVPVQSGNSGGPLLDARGEVVGIVTSKLDALGVAQRTGDLPQNVNYAIKSRYLQGLLDDLNIQSAASSNLPSENSLENVAAKVTGSVVQIFVATAK